MNEVEESVEALLDFLLLDLSHVLAPCKHVVVMLLCVEKQDSASSVQQTANFLKNIGSVSLHPHAASAKGEKSFQLFRVVHVLVNVEEFHTAEAVIYIGLLLQFQAEWLWLFFMISFIDVIGSEKKDFPPGLLSKFRMVGDVFIERDPGIAV